MNNVAWCFRFLGKNKEKLAWGTNKLLQKDVIFTQIRQLALIKAGKWTPAMGQMLIYIYAAGNK